MKPRLAQLGQSGATDAQVPVWDAATGKWAPGPGVGSLVVITYAVPDSTGALIFPWGINTAGQPTYDAAGAAAGTEARLVRDLVTGNYYVEAITP